MFNTDASCSPTQRFVACPILRDLNTNAAGLDYLKVEVKNYSLGGCLDNTVWCNLYAMDEDSATGNYVDYEYRSTTVTGEQQLTFSSLSTTLATSAGGEGSYMLWCGLGGFDSLHQFTVRELYGTD